MTTPIRFPKPVPGRIAIAPSILSADFARLADEIRRLETAGADWIHVDVMDGHFVPNITIGPVVVKWLRKHSRLPLDVHLMIESPEKYIPAFAHAGASLLTVHWEACPRPRETIRLIRKQGCAAGMSIRPKTSISKTEPYIKALDLVLVMTVEPGFGGQDFMPAMIPKVRRIREQINRAGARCWIEVDGGINPKTADDAVNAGANALVAGHAIFAGGKPALAIKNLRRSAENSAS